MDTTQHKQKVIGEKQNQSRTFIIMPEGDGKMNHHMMVYLMSCADSKWWIIVCVDCWMLLC